MGLDVSTSCRQFRTRIYRLADPSIQRDVIHVLHSTHSVSLAAIAAGVSLTHLSHWLNRTKARRAWWERLKRRWKRQHAAQRKARWRARNRIPTS